MFRRRFSGKSSRSTDLEAAKLAALAAESAAQRAAASADQAVELLRALEEHQTEATPRRFRTLLKVCGGLALAILACGWLVTPAFSDPAPRVTRPGLMQVVVELPDGADAATRAAATHEVVVNAKFNEGDGEMSYAVSFPELLHGYGFKILLAGSAVLHDVPPVVHDELADEHHKCSGAEIIPNHYAEGLECQVFSGTVEGDGPTLLQDCRVDDGSRPDLEGEYYETQVWGTSSARDQVDWAHITTNLPDLEGTFDWDRKREWAGFRFSRPVVTVLPTTCEHLDVSEARMNHLSSDDPAEAGAAGLSWGPVEGLEAIAVTSTVRSAPAIGNLLLAALGILGAVLIGLVPVTYEAWRRHRRFLSLTARADVAPQGEGDTDGSRSP